MSNNIESPELTFMTKIHEMTSNADLLIKTYSETLAVFKSLPDDFEFPNKPESIELVELTLNTILELKVAVTSLTEHSAEMNDAIDAAVRKLNIKK